MLEKKRFHFKWRIYLKQLGIRNLANMSRNTGIGNLILFHFILIIWYMIFQYLIYFMLRWPLSEIWAKTAKNRRMWPLRLRWAFSIKKLVIYFNKANENVSNKKYNCKIIILFLHTYVDMDRIRTLI